MEELGKLNIVSAVKQLIKRWMKQLLLIHNLINSLIAANTLFDALMADHWSSNELIIRLIVRLYRAMGYRNHIPPNGPVCFPASCGFHNPVNHLTAACICFGLCGSSTCIVYNAVNTEKKKIAVTPMIMFTEAANNGNPECKTANNGNPKCKMTLIFKNRIVRLQDKTYVDVGPVKIIGSFLGEYTKK